MQILTCALTHSLFRKAEYKGFVLMLNCQRYSILKLYEYNDYSEVRNARKRNGSMHLLRNCRLGTPTIEPYIHHRHSLFP